MLCHIYGYLWHIWMLFFLQGSVPNKFYVHNDMFRYEDEVFGDSEPELDEGEVTFRWKGSVSTPYGHET